MKNLKNNLVMAIALLTVTSMVRADLFGGLGQAVEGAVSGAGRVVEGAVEGTGRAVQGVTQGATDVVSTPTDSTVIVEEEELEPVDEDEIVIEEDVE